VDGRARELLQYVKFDADDAVRLRAFRAVARPSFATIVQEFYERTREHDDAHAVFQGEDQIARLRSSLMTWLERLLGGTYDGAYFAQTAQIGRVHVKVGLPPRYMPVAMGLVRGALSSVATERLEAGEAAGVHTALCKILDVELAIMLEAYREDSLDRLARATALERAELERRAAQPERRYVNAVELARCLLVGLDAEGRVRLFNHHAERVSGHARDEADGRPFADLLLPDDLPVTEAKLHDRTDERAIELPMRARNGRMRTVSWQVARVPASDADDGIVAFVTGRDVTDETTARQRHEQQDRLAAIGTLAAGLAHEIRNPLNGAQLHVSFLARALARSAVNEDALEAVHVIDDEIKRLARLVTEFLDFARPQPLTLTSVSVGALAERVIGLVAEQAGASDVRLLQDLPSTDIAVSADGGKLEQVLLNLLRNGVEALSGRGGTVTLRARREPRAVVLEVEDDGPGIPAASAPIFDAFFSTKPGGTGLGLAIVHRIVTDHGGTIDVESRPGMTCFRLRLPLGGSSAQTEDRGVAR